MNGSRRRIAALLAAVAGGHVRCGRAHFVRRGSARASCASTCPAVKTTRTTAKRKRPLQYPALGAIGGVLEQIGAWIRLEEYNESVVPTTHKPKLRTPKTDPHLQGAGERVKAAAEELERLGIADENGRRVRTDAPEDMKDGAERDFGG